MRILLIEDDSDAAEVVAQGLTETGHQVVTAIDAAQGLRRADDDHFDVIVLDRMLPDGDGLGVLESLRGRGNDTPVVFLSALGEVDQRVEGLKAGGDDYLAKPFALTELLARLEAVVRRRESMAATALKVGDLEADLISRRVRRAGVDIPLQPREFRLLTFLMGRAGQVVTRSMLLEGVWNYHFDPETKVIDVQMSRLRQKIDRDFPQPLIHTVRGMGYCLREPDTAG